MCFRQRQLESRDYYTRLTRLLVGTCWNATILAGVLHNLTYPASIAFAAHITGPEEIGVISTGYLTMTYLSMLASQAVQPMYIETQVSAAVLLTA